MQTRSTAAITPYSLSRDHSKRLFFIITMWMITYPFGVAVQNMANATAFILLTMSVVEERKTIYMRLTMLPRNLVLAWTGLILFTLCNVIGGLLNTELNNHLSSYVSGRLALILFPFIIYALGGFKLFEEQKDRFARYLIGILGIWTLILVSQFFWSWGIRGTSIVNYGHRPEGFYSNALTLAYAYFLLFPLICVKFFERKNLFWGACFLCVTAGLVVNNSRAVILVAGLLTLLNVATVLKGKLRLAGLTVVLCSAAAILATDNPISSRIKTFTSPSPTTTYKGYADHRFVFWDVYLDMIKEKPVFGHGPKLTTKYNEKYYDARGFEDFHKKYNAHNQFIQIAATGGLTGLFFFLCWAVLFTVAIVRHVPDKITRLILVQTFLGFMVAGVTQNAFQDAEVRQGIFLFSMFSVVMIMAPARLGGSFTAKASSQ